MARERTLAKRTLVSLLQGLEGETTTIDFRDETSVRGKIIAFDGYMNVVMTDVTYTAPSGIETQYERYCGQGKFIRYVHIPEDVNPMRTIKNRLEDIREQSERRGRGGRGGRRGGRGGGRRGGGRYGGRGGGGGGGGHRSGGSSHRSGGDSYRSGGDSYRSGGDSYRSSGGGDSYRSSSGGGDRYRSSSSGGDRYRSGGSSYEGGGSSYGDHRSSYGGGSSGSYSRSRY